MKRTTEQILEEGRRRFEEKKKTEEEQERVRQDRFIQRLKSIFPDIEHIGGNMFSLAGHVFRASWWFGPYLIPEDDFRTGEIRKIEDMADLFEFDQAEQARRARKEKSLGNRIKGWIGSIFS